MALWLIVIFLAITACVLFPALIPLLGIIGFFALLFSPLLFVAWLINSLVRPRPRVIGVVAVGPDALHRPAWVSNALAVFLILFVAFLAMLVWRAH